MTSFSLTDLNALIIARAASDPAQSYTAKLSTKGIEKCAQKLGEEAMEAAIAAVTRNQPELTKEAADVLYHLLVVLHVAEVPLADVMAELARRTGQSGLEEKAARFMEDK